MVFSECLQRGSLGLIDFTEASSVGGLCTCLVRFSLQCANIQFGAKEFEDNPRVPKCGTYNERLYPQIVRDHAGTSGKLLIVAFVQIEIKRSSSNVSRIIESCSAEGGVGKASC
jgi:hypothetical protein